MCVREKQMYKPRGLYIERGEREGEREREGRWRGRWREREKGRWRDICVKL